MKNITRNLTNRNIINLKKINIVNDVDNDSYNNQKEKRLLHLALMKFIKTQYNKKQDKLIKKPKYKGFFQKYNHLNLLPYLKKKILEKNNDKNLYLSAYSNSKKNKNHFYKTNYIDEYNAKNDSSKRQSKSTKDKNIIDKNKYKNRIKSSFIGEASKYKSFYQISERKKTLNNNILPNREFIGKNYNIFDFMQNSYFNIYNINFLKRKNSSKIHKIEFVNEDDINNEKTNFDTPQKENSLNYRNKINSAISEIKSKKILAHINDLSNNAEIHFQSIKFGKENNKFGQLFIRKNKNKSKNNKNLTCREDKNIPKLINSTQERINSNSRIIKNQNTKNYKNKIITNIKSFYESSKNPDFEIKTKSSDTNRNINSINYKFSFKYKKKNYKNFYKNQYDKFDIISSKNENNISNSFKKSPLLNKKFDDNYIQNKLIKNKKIDIKDNFHIEQNFGQLNKNKFKINQKSPITFNIKFNIINNRKNNNNDIIDLI